jgi:hypothetical protein
MTKKANKFNVVAFCLDWETGDLPEDEIREGFQHLINSGLAWQLQGCYGRFANSLIDAGLCNRRKSHDF